MAAAMTLLVSVFSLYFLFSRPTFLDPNELVFLKGTLKEKLVIDTDGKNHKSIDINLVEYPQTIFNISNSSFSSIAYPEELILNSHSGDSIIIGISQDEYKKQTATLTSDPHSDIFVFTINRNTIEYSSVESYNQSIEADKELGKYILPIISAAFLIMTLYYRWKLANTGQ